MYKEKEIEEMANKVCALYGKDCKDCVNKKTCMVEDDCKTLFNAGYGNIKEYQDEIDRLSTELAHREEDLIHADEKVFYREQDVKLDEDKIKQKAVKEFAEKLKDQFCTECDYGGGDIKQIIDELMKELYG